MDQKNKLFKQALQNIIKNTYKHAKKTILFMLKIIIPITFGVMLLQYLDLIKYVTFIFEPLMKYFGLSGEAALVLITSNLINIYGGLAVMASLTFSVKEVTILGVMILFSHSLIVEVAIIKGLNISIKKQLFIRIVSALISGVILNVLIGDHYSEIANNRVTISKEIPPFSLESFPIFFHWFKTLMVDYFLNIVNTTFKLVWIITAVLFGLEVLKEFNVLDKLNNILFYFTKHLGVSKSATSSLLIGLFIGITYGAGAILIHYKEGKMNKKDVLLVTTFLLLCHAIVEDVFLFIQVGAVPWILITYKIAFAIIVTFIYNLILSRKSDLQKGFNSQQ
ncbi:nucleoside recognition domain-containing protein [Haloplasma contractile]|uniref:Nucleoside recognition domain protein n=1 Tax=Haloplasma contractile SSD-17B TaxID=1033810 RepID=F7PTN2_9MOLU|nr:nucleoside recognition domain-containing protein [Haloplasma contractile]ERJ12198.1 Nucleoside recognition domain protein [Haloplasma contractile SSD-17B]